MKTFLQQKFRLYSSELTFSQFDTVSYVRKTPLSYSHEMIPLVNFAPEAKVIVKHLSNKAKWAMRLGALLIGVFYAAYFSIDDFQTTVDLSSSLIFFGILMTGGIFYYYAETRTILAFCDYNLEKIYMRFFYDKHSEEQKELIKTFDQAVRNARVNHDQRNLTRLQTGIDSLEKQQIISTTFGDVLHARVAQLTGKII